MNDHTAVAIAQIVFYVPVVPLAIWLMVRNGSMRPRMAWWPLIPFSIIRLAGGPVVIALEKHPGSIALATVAIILLNVGAVPLIIAASGFLRIILMDNYKTTRGMERFSGMLRVGIVFSVALLAAGGGIGGQDSKALRQVGRVVTLTGYACFATVLVVISGTAAFFYTRKACLITSSAKVIHGLLASSPFIMVRCVYGILQVVFEFRPSSTWSPLYGSAVAFALMACLAEYVAVMIFFYVGFSIPPDRGAKVCGGNAQGATAAAA